MDRRRLYTGRSDQLRVCVDGCLFVATVYEKRDGGCDVQFDYKSSDLANLDAGHITRLRHLSDLLGEIFVDQFRVPLTWWREDSLTGDTELVSPWARRRARQLLRDWIARNLPVEERFGDRVRQTCWIAMDYVNAVFGSRHWD